MQCFRCRYIQGRHRFHRRGKRLLRRALFLQRRCDHSCPEWLRKQQHVTRARADISPNLCRMNRAGNGISKKHVVRSNRMPAQNAAIRFLHLGQAAAKNSRQNLWI